ncbi:hypothetical protein ACT3SP_11040 [Brachybacterium sp. AOP43-C2-M15]|uniref:hypothetical protein n=1 Tax=Brachybacterium sp. AOP43-C2-M15 TaxID=3457661 RepID=UPI0040331B5D
MRAEGDQQDWTRHRREVFEAKEQALHAAREAEHEQATAMIREAVTRFREAGIPPVPLRARPFRGGGTIRTGLEGWYLKQDRSLAVDAEGRYYVLRVDGGLLSRLRGATPAPRHAPLVVGRGARDGDTFGLDELLEMRLQDPVAA